MTKRRRPRFTFGGLVVRNIYSRSGKLAPIDDFYLSKSRYTKTLRDGWGSAAKVDGSIYRQSMALYRIDKETLCELDAIRCPTCRWYRRSSNCTKNVCNDCHTVIFNISTMRIDLETELI
jgi:hypothetical protein